MRLSGSEAFRPPGVIRSTRGQLILCAVLVTSSGCTDAGQEAAGTPTTSPVSSSKPTTTVAQSTDTTDPEGEQVLQSIMEEWAHQNDPIGVAAGARFPDGSLWLGASGLADNEQEIPIAATDRFVVGSITKTFMAALTVRLVEEDIVQLDETISTYLPDSPAGGDMTIRDLLGHRAGVYDAYGEISSQGAAEPTRVFTPEELLAAAAAHTPTFVPGSAQEYSNSGYWVLGAVLEAATSTDTGSLLDSYVIDSLGLENTLFFDSSLPEVEVVNAYEDLDGDIEMDALGTTPLPGLFTPAWTAGGVISNVGDLLTFLSGLFAGELIEEESLDEMLDLSTDDSPYALGIYQLDSLWGHDGVVWGYLSQVFHDVDTGVTVAVLVNRSSAPHPGPLAQRLATSAGELAES
jgi:D-alanyl-D-alanine carboxypeptidase